MLTCVLGRGQRPSSLSEGHCREGVPRQSGGVSQLLPGPRQWGGQEEAGTPTRCSQQRRASPTLQPQILLPSCFLQSERGGFPPQGTPPPPQKVSSADSPPPPKQLRVRLWHEHLCWFLLQSESADPPDSLQRWGLVPLRAGVCPTLACQQPLASWASGALSPCPLGHSAQWPVQ